MFDNEYNSNEIYKFTNLKPTSTIQQYTTILKDFDTNVQYKVLFLDSGIYSYNEKYNPELLNKFFKNNLELEAVYINSTIHVTEENIKNILNLKNLKYLSLSMPLLKTNNLFMAASKLPNYTSPNTENHEAFKINEALFDNLKNLENLEYLKIYNYHYNTFNKDINIVENNAINVFNNQTVEYLKKLKNLKEFYITIDENIESKCFFKYKNELKHDCGYKHLLNFFPNLTRFGYNMVSNNNYFYNIKIYDICHQCKYTKLQNDMECKIKRLENIIDKLCGNNGIEVAV